jgi:hypothetical protein
MGLDGTVEVRGSKDFTGTLASNASASLNGVAITFAAGDDLGTIVGKINLEEANTGVHASAVGPPAVADSVDHRHTPNHSRHSRWRPRVLRSGHRQRLF